MRSRMMTVMGLVLALFLTGCSFGFRGEETKPVEESHETKMEPDTEKPETTPPETPSAPESEETEPRETEGTEQDGPREPAPVPDDGKIHVHTVTLNVYRTSIEVGLTDMPLVTMLPTSAPDQREIWSSDNESVATVDPYGRITGVSEGVCTVTVASADNPLAYAEVKVTVCGLPEVTEPTVIDGILLVNKTYRLPASYNKGVDPEAEAALEEMTAAAKRDGIELFVVSGFRSYEKQTNLYNTYVGREGKIAADRYSARPGSSEHQAGLAFDLNSLEQSFGETAEGRWLAAHCAEYGFIIRYPADKEDKTGFMYEPWHVRYLGLEKAKAVEESGLCLEEYLGVVSQYAIE